MRVKFKIYTCLVVIFFTTEVYPIQWIALQHAQLQWNATQRIYKISNKEMRFNDSPACREVRKYYGFSKIQTRICRATIDLMLYIQKAAKLTAEVCKNVFSGRRWNCSSIDLAPNLTPDLTRGTREQAYLYAISSAALTFIMSKICTTGLLPQYCSCAENPRDPPNGNFKWGGCGDNMKWGTNFARHFTDSQEKRSWKHLSDENGTIKQMQRASVNLHNNRVGRRTLQENIGTQCKCHGVSGSCNIKTCWKSLYNFNQIGELLFRKYTNAIEISKYYYSYKSNIPEVPGRKSPSLNQLIYYNRSPDYCIKDESLGSFGTNGRECNATANGTNGCKQLCCGRGFKTVTKEVIEQCQCRYYYCCYVKCKMCSSFTQVHICN